MTRNAIDKNHFSPVMPDGFRSKKQLGQNFLVDPKVKEKIISHCDLDPQETVLEIGPGLGALTFELSQRVKSVLAIETDRKLAQHLERQFHNTNVQIIHADFLKFPLTSLASNLKVIGNLPYYISTPIIEKVITHPEYFNSLFITIQSELGERIVAQTDTKSYGSFSCFVQYYAQPKKLFRIKSTAFRPIPKVQSCFLKLAISRPLKGNACDETLLFQMIQKAFQQRRKKITNALSSLMAPDQLSGLLEDVGIDPSARAENITLHQYIAMTQRWQSLGH